MDYVESNVGKGLADADRPSKGKERESWPELAARFQDKAWKQDGLKRDEKFEMHFSAAVRTLPIGLIHKIKQVLDQQRAYAALLVAEGSLKAGNTSQHPAHSLIDESTDILAIALDKQVRLPQWVILRE